MTPELFELVAERFDVLADRSVFRLSDVACGRLEAEAKTRRKASSDLSRRRADP